MRTEPNTDAVRKHATSSGVIASVQMAANADEFWVLDSVCAGYDAIPTPSSIYLAVQIGPTFVFRVRIPKVAGARRLKFPRGLYTGTKNERMRVDLAYGGSGITGFVNAVYR